MLSLFGLGIFFSLNICIMTNSEGKRNERTIREKDEEKLLREKSFQTSYNREMYFAGIFNETSRLFETKNKTSGRNYLAHKFWVFRERGFPFTPPFLENYEAVENYFLHISFRQLVHFLS